MNRLDGKIALLSGAARGIGAETARLMVEAGAAVVVGDVLDERGRETVRTLEEAGGKAFYHVSGGFALALTALAMYGGAALGLEDAHQREVLPLFRRGAAAESFEGYEAQLGRLEAEAGVRQQL